jgi:hypothetical protein
MVDFFLALRIPAGIMARHDEERKETTQKKGRVIASRTMLSLKGDGVTGNHCGTIPQAASGTNVLSRSLLLG